jgi:hypothetical protein
MTTPKTEKLTTLQAIEVVLAGSRKPMTVTLDRLGVEPLPPAVAPDGDGRGQTRGVPARATPTVPVAPREPPS